MTPKNQISGLDFDPLDLMPGLSIDCVIIGFDLHALNILVMKLHNMDVWSLPGGFIRKDEAMDHAASRILEERSGISLPYLQQFHTFGEVNRRDLSTFLNNLQPPFNTPVLISWLKQRFISTGYLSLVDMRKSTPTPDVLSEAGKWIPVRELPELLFDHRNIVGKALEHIRNQINYMPVGKSLLPKKFTMKDLQVLYESILDRQLDRGNFQKKILKLGFLIRHEKKKGGGSHKAPFLYSFNAEKYKELLEQGIGYIS